MSGELSKINGLEAGKRLALGRSLYVRRAQDGTVTGYLRVRQGERLVDVRLLALTLPLTKVTLGDLMQAAERVRAEHRRGKLPVAAPKSKLPETPTVGQMWAERLRNIDASGKWSTRTRANNVLRVAKHLAPCAIWDKPVSEVTATDLSDILLPLRRVSPNQAQKVSDLLSGIFALAVHTGHVTRSPASDAKEIVRGASRAAQTKHFPILTDTQQLRAVYASIDTLSGSAAVRACLKTQALTCLRSGEAVALRWSMLSDGVLTVPRALMKRKDREHDHTLILPPAVSEWLESLRPANSGSQLMFRSHRGESAMLTTESLSTALRRGLKLDGIFVPHSWRGSMATLASRACDQDGRPLFSESWIDGLLDHLSKDKVRGAYVRAGDSQGPARILSWWAGVLR